MEKILSLGSPTSAILSSHGGLVSPPPSSRGPTGKRLCPGQPSQSGEPVRPGLTGPSDYAAADSEGRFLLLFLQAVVPSSQRGFERRKVSSRKGHGQ